MDISAVGYKVIFKGGGIGELEVSEFSEEGTPFESIDADLSDNRKTFYGEMVSSRTPSVYQFAITVIPGSIADAKLRRAAALAAIQPGNNTESDAAKLYFTTVQVIAPMVIRVKGSAAPSQYTGGSPNEDSRSVVYTNVRIKSAPTGPTTSAEGRLQPMRYVFEAEGFSNASATIV